MLGRFYSTNSHTVISNYHAFTSYSTKRQLVKICNVSRNLSSWFSAMSRGISLSCLQPIYISILNCLYPFWAWNEIKSFCFCFVEMGWFPVRISWTTLFSVQIWINQSKWLKWADSQFGILDTLRFSPIYELSVRMDYPMRSLENDKAIEVRSQIIRTRLGC